MIYTSVVSRRGFSHPDWNEDNFYLTQTEKYLVGAVFDGCSTGTDSYFASKLFANVFKQTLKKEGETLNRDLFPAFVYSFFCTVLKVASTMQLGLNELLSTAVIFLYSKYDSELLVRFFGDGVVFYKEQMNGFQELKNDELNQPDYIAYSLKEMVQNNSFGQYWDSRRSLCLNTNDFTISTDGIGTFRKRDAKLPEIDVVPYLVQDPFLYKNPASLRRKLNILKNKGYRNEDDVTLIRIINECS
jgi:hypothetical protein